METMKKKVRKGTSLLWASRQFSLYFSYAVIGYIQYYCTDQIGLNAAVVGSLLLASKILDAISNFIIANVVDNAHFKWGKGRPWEISVIPMWLCIILMFSVPQGWGDTAKYAMVFLFYTLINAVCSTFLNCIDAIYLKHAFPENDARTKVQTVTGAIGTIGMMIGTILMPMMIDYFDHVEHGWTIMTAIIGIPLAFIGSLRFLTIPEVDAGQAHKEDTEHITLWETIKAFVSNRYTLMIMVTFLAVNVMNTFSASPTTYYFKYVVGDISKQTVVSMMSILCIVVLIFISPLVKRFGNARVVQMGFLIAAVSYALRYFCGSNLIALAVTGFLGAAAVLPYSTLNNLMLIDSMDYGEWKSQKRQEAAVFAGASLGTTIGNGVGSSLSGLVLDLFGYDGTAAVQSASALLGIKICFSILPAIMMLVGFAALIFYDLEKKLPRIHEDLKKEREAH